MDPFFGFHIGKGIARNVNTENGPQTGPVFWTPKRGLSFGEIVKAFAAASDTRQVCLNMKFFAGLHF